MTTDTSWLTQTPRTMTTKQITWLTKRGVTIQQITEPMPLLATEKALYFQNEDTFWRPNSGSLVSMNGDWCLGDMWNRLSADMTEGPLVIHETPLEWLKNDRLGIVVIKWDRLFAQLSECAPRVSLPAALVEKYTEWMKPANLPKIEIRENDDVE